MKETTSFDRHKLEIFGWPQLMQHFGPLARVCLGDGELPRMVKQEAFMLLSLASGFRICRIAIEADV